MLGVHASLTITLNPSFLTKCEAVSGLRSAQYAANIRLGCQLVKHASLFRHGKKSCSDTSVCEGAKPLFIVYEFRHSLFVFLFFGPSAKTTKSFGMNNNRRFSSQLNWDSEAESNDGGASSSCQLDVLSTFCFINLLFHQLIIFSTCYFFNLLFCQLAVLSTCYFINLLFHQLAVSSTCCFINLLFHQLAVSSTCCFINLLFHQRDAS